MSSHIYTDSDFTTALIKDVNKRKKLTVVFAVGGSILNYTPRQKGFSSAVTLKVFRKTAGKASVQTTAPPAVTDIKTNPGPGFPSALCQAGSELLHLVRLSHTVSFSRIISLKSRRTVFLWVQTITETSLCLIQDGASGSAGHQYSISAAMLPIRRSSKRDGVGGNERAHQEM